MPDAPGVSIVPTPTGLPSMRVQREDRSFITLHSLHDPWEDASRFADAVELKPGTRLYLVLGVGLGYHLLTLAHRLRNAGSEAALWGVETHEGVLEACMRTTDMGLLYKLGDGRVLSRRGLSRLVGPEGSLFEGRIQVLRHAPSVSLDPRGYAQWERAAEELSAAAVLAERWPSAKALLAGAPSTAQAAVRQALRDIKGSGPPYGPVEAVFLLLDRVHHHE